MHQLLSLLYNAASFIVIISTIVFVHEFGHYIVAKWAGVKIETFSLGFGKELFGFNDRSGTRWKLSALPLGGYVKMYGDASEASTPLEDIADLSDIEKQKTFHYKPLYKKAAIVVAGPLANFILTIVILTGFIATSGLPSTEPVVGDVLKDTPAQAAGLQRGDRVLSVNGDSVSSFNDIPRLIATNLGTPVTLEIQRAGQTFSVILTPKEVVDKDGLGNDITHPLIGIKTSEIKFRNVGLARALWESARDTYYRCTSTLHAIEQMITLQRSAKDIKGPLGIAVLSGQAANRGFLTILSFIATLSANLGLVNLLPIPVLDGGHLLYYAIEAVQGKPLAKKFQEYGSRVGLAMVAMLMAFAILNDIKNILFAA